MPTTLVHCSYHKCLTSYFARVMNKVYVSRLRLRGGYFHFRSELDEFYRDHARYGIVSVNNHVVDPDRLGDEVRITRFIRDPRDLVVSGYFYHRRAAEAWCAVIDPSAADWRGVNGNIPSGMSAGHSFSSYLQTLDEEDGLIAEIDFRLHHFTSMLQWPEDDARVRLFRYEAILGHEAETFAEILRHYGVSAPEIWYGARIAARYAAGSRRGAGHIRDPKAGQWQRVFTPRVNDYFEQRHGAVLDRYGYR